MKKNYFKSLMQVALLLAAPFVVSSCDDIIGQEDNPVASYIQWKNDPGAEVTMKIGDKKVIATATAVSSAIIAYESSDTAVATIDPVNAEITAKAVGETTISAVISGMSTNGRSVFEATKISFKLIVKDGKAKLTRKFDSFEEFTVNADSTIDVSKFFTAYPEKGNTISYSLSPVNDKTPANFSTSKTTILGDLSGTGVKIKNGTINDWTKKGKDITDTLYVAATITTAASEYTIDAKANLHTDTVMIIINKSIAYMNEKGKRTILTADKYKELDLTATSAVEAGTYYVTKAPTSYPTAATDIKGDVTLIFKNTVDAFLQNLDDKTDNATLNIFGEAKQKGTTPGVYEAWNPIIDIKGATDNAITNFKEINIYTGTITVRKAITAVKDVNVNAGTLTVTPGTSGYAIKLSGNLTINGGSVTATGTGTDTDNSFAVIGNVVYNKGTFDAHNDDYRAVNGTLTAASGFEFLQGDTSDKSKATKLEGTTSTSKYIWGQKTPTK